MHCPYSLNSVMTGWWKLIQKNKRYHFPKEIWESTLAKHLFYINKGIIEIADSYTYLGVRFFKENKVILKDKTRRSIFATCCYLDSPKLPVNVINKIFNSLYLSVLMYGSEVWNIYNKDYYNSWEKDIIETTHLYFCKQDLGVKK